MINVGAWLIISLIACLIVYKKTIRLKLSRNAQFFFFYHFLGNFAIPIHIFTDFVEK